MVGPGSAVLTANPYAGQVPEDHYFTANPASAPERRALRVTLGERELELVTASGIFSPDRVDEGTAVLLANTPAPRATGNLLDIGCGWGPISLSLALASPDATVWAVDVNERAIDLLARNAALLGLTNVRALRPEEVPEAVRFAEIWSNPPIRVGKAVLHGLLQQWLPRLEAGGDAWLVVQKNLGADSLQRWITEQFPDAVTERVAVGRGYRVLRHTSPA